MSLLRISASRSYKPEITQRSPAFFKSKELVADVQSLCRYEVQRAGEHYYLVTVGRMPCVSACFSVRLRSGFASGFTVARGPGLTAHVGSPNRGALSCHGGWSVAPGLQRGPAWGLALGQMAGCRGCAPTSHAPRFSQGKSLFPATPVFFPRVRSRRAHGGSPLSSQLERVSGQPVPKMHGEEGRPLGAHPACAPPLRGGLPSKKGLQDPE